MLKDPPPAGLFFFPESDPLSSGVKDDEALSLFLQYYARRFFFFFFGVLGFSSYGYAQPFFGRTRPRPLLGRGVFLFPFPSFRSGFLLPLPPLRPDDGPPFDLGPAPLFFLSCKRRKSFSNIEIFPPLPSWESDCACPKKAVIVTGYFHGARNKAILVPLPPVHERIAAFSPLPESLFERHLFCVLSS